MRLTTFFGSIYRRWYFALLIACVLAGFSYAIYRLPLFQVLERKVEDLHFILNETVPDSSIVLIAIDDNSLEFTRENHLPWPWPRDIWYPILTFLQQSGAKNILFDLQFTDPDFDRAETFADETDGMFAEAIRNKGDVILGVQLVPESTGVSPDIGTFCIAEPAIPAESRYQGMLEPIEVLRKAASKLGVINVEPDDDGIIRRIPLYYRIEDVILPQVALAPVCERNQAIHSNKEGKFRLYWYGSGGVDGAFGEQYISMCYVLALARQHLYGESSAEAQALMKRLQGKYIIIGTTAGGLFDLKPTPTDRIFPGMEIWATALSNYLCGDNVYNLPIELHLLVLVLIAFGVYFSFARFEQSVIVPLLLSVTVIFILSIVCWRTWSLLLPVISILNTFLIAYFVTATMHYLHDRRQGKTSDSHRVQSLPERGRGAGIDPRTGSSGNGWRRGRSDGVLLRYRQFHENIRESHTERTGTLSERLFRRLRGYPHEAGWTPGQIHRRRTDGALRRADLAGGPRDSRLQGSARAQTAQPIPDRQSGRRRHAAFSSQHAHRDQLGKNRLRQYRLSVKRMDYTAIGDDVNLAARLEAVNKIYLTSILISESTYRLVENVIQCRELDTIRVKGKAKPTKIYEVVAPAGEPYDKKADRFIRRGTGKIPCI